MTLEWILTQNNIDPNKDLTIDKSISFGAMSGSFIAGIGDFVSLFEPNALEIESEGYGYVVASLGDLGGNVPYTSYNARISYIENNPEIISKFNKAVQKGLDFVNNNNSETIANIILNHFPDTSLNDLIKIIDRYKKQDTWPKTTSFSETSFNHLQDIMINAKQLDKKVLYEDLIYIIDE